MDHYPYLLYLGLIPFVLAILSLQLMNSQALRTAVPFMQWMQFGVITYVAWPVLTGACTQLRFTNDFSIDRLSTCFILLTTAVVASSMTHAVSFFAAESQKEKIDPLHERVFYAAANAFLFAMTFVFMCNNLGLLWVCIEATTLSSAPLVYFDRTSNAIEATWKYLIICSVGIAFALLGTIMIFASSQQIPGHAPSLNIVDLVATAPHLNGTLLHLGFIFCLLGYGTKAGIFPMHNWLPDAHSEAPAPASAMLSGALLNCALFGIWRVSHIIVAAHDRSHAVAIVTVMGATTALAGSLFLIRQHSFKRIWAYSSIENVGIMLTTIGLGSGTLFFCQALNHSLAKVTLFLVSGNIVQAAGTKRLSGLHGILDAQPIWAVLLICGALAASGTPPFGMFWSELQILVATATPSHWPIALTLVVALTVSFVAIGVHVGRIVCGGAKQSFSAYRPLSASIMPALLIAASLALGLFAPAKLWSFLEQGPEPLRTASPEALRPGSTAPPSIY